MTKAALLHLTISGLVASLTLPRTAPKGRDLIKPPEYQGQATEAEVPKEFLELWEDQRYGSYWKVSEPTPELPEYLVGKNLVFAGDHVDREAVEHICLRYDAKMTSFNELRATTSVAGRKFDHSPAKSVSSNHLLCHLGDIDDARRNVSIMYLWHPGVMSTPPNSDWYQQELRKNWTKYLHKTEINGAEMFVDQAQDLAKVYWRKAIQDHLPSRPTVFVTQSSILDSLLGEEFVRSKDKSSKLLEKGQTEYGWESVYGLNGHWGWNKHASTFMNAIKQGVSPEKVIWRTTPNCPETSKRESDFAREVFSQQEALVHQMITAGDAHHNKPPESPQEEAARMRSEMIERAKQYQNGQTYEDYQARMTEEKQKQSMLRKKRLQRVSGTPIAKNKHTKAASVLKTTTSTAPYDGPATTTTTAPVPLTPEEEHQKRHQERQQALEAWAGVKVMDWRKVYEVYDEERNGCDRSAEQTRARYENYMQTLWQTLAALSEMTHETDL